VSKIYTMVIEVIHSEPEYKPSYTIFAYYLIKDYYS